jgi:hypothetical protein
MDNGRRNTELDFMGEPGSGASNQQVRKRLWKLQVPGKIKIFLAGGPFMACRLILANRHIIPSGGCPVCHHGAEDIKHMIFSCDRAKAIWNSIGIW